MELILNYEDILTAAPDWLGYILAADYFCKKYLGTSNKGEKLFVLSFFFLQLFANIAARQYPVLYILFIFLHRIIFIGMVLLFFQSDKEKKILASSMLIACRILIGNFCGSFFSCLLLFYRHTVKGMEYPFLRGGETQLLGYISLLAVMAALYWLSGHLLPVFYDGMGKWHIMMAVPLLVMTAVLDVAEWGASNGIMVRSAGNMGLYYDQLFSYAEFFILSALFLPAAWLYVSGMNRIFMEQKKSSAYHSQAAVYRMLKEQYSQSERLRHDMKNHIIALSGLFQSREWEKLGIYLRKLEGISQKNGGEVTGNKAVDALLYQKRERAQRVCAAWECDVQIPKACSMDEFDLCVLFGNLLDNALDACERMGCRKQSDPVHRFVSIQAKTVKKCFLLEVKNSMDDIKKQNSPKGHGIGLLNVSDAVHKYNGTLNISAENGIFTVSILMPFIQ